MSQGARQPFEGGATAGLALHPGFGPPPGFTESRGRWRGRAQSLPTSLGGKERLEEAGLGGGGHARPVSLTHSLSHSLPGWVFGQERKEKPGVVEMVSSPFPHGEIALPRGSRAPVRAGPGRRSGGLPAQTPTLSSTSSPSPTEAASFSARSRRLKANRRSPPCMAGEIPGPLGSLLNLAHVLEVGPPASSANRSPQQPRTTVRRLLKSWATPPASQPMLRASGPGSVPPAADWVR